MAWLLCTKVLIVMLLVTAMWRTRSSRRLLIVRADSISRTRVHLVASCPVGAISPLEIHRGQEYFVDDFQYRTPREDGYFLDVGVFAGTYPPLNRFEMVLRVMANGLLFLMRQFAIRVLGAEWRLRQD